jgi:hypothetical protein|tara:strand:- start:2943 stop:3182 length:240 start_codon:yes stop_codon:yes gene_type:complete
MEVTIYLLEDEGIKSRTTCFPFKTEATLKKHLTSIYGDANMDKVEWDIIEPEEEEGLEEIEEPETEIGSYLKRKMRRKR